MQKKRNIPKHVPKKSIREDEMMKVTYERLPEHMREGVTRYIDDGVPPGTFLTYALANNLAEAYVRADNKNKANMEYWASWLLWECPQEAWGSMEKVEKWIRRGGLNGNRR